MIRVFISRPAVRAALLVACACACPGWQTSAHAQVPAAADTAKMEAHPAVKVVRDYLQLMLQREWTKAAALVDPASLKQMLADYMKRLDVAPTMDDEEEMTRRVGKPTVEAVGAMTPVDFYVAYHQGLQERYKVPPEVMEKVRASLLLRVLSVGQEDDTHTHVLVRTKHSNDKAVFESLELVSLVKIGDTWKVGLNEQSPRITPLGEGGKPGESAAVETPKPAAPKAKPKSK